MKNLKYCILILIFILFSCKDKYIDNASNYSSLVTNDFSSQFLRYPTPGTVEMIKNVAVWPQILSGKSSRREEKPPNILLALSDNHSWEHVGAYGNKVIKTPTIDRIAQEGILFTHAFSNSPACAPARAALLTGRNFWELEEAAIHFSEFPKKFDVYPDILEKNGYHVGFTGKGWGPGDFEEGGRSRNPAGNEYNKILLKEEIDAEHPEGISDIDYAGNFREFLSKKGKDAPFCFWYGSREPHRSFAKGIGVKSGLKMEDVKVPPFLPDVSEVRSDLLDYYYEIEWFDKQLGKMLQLLEEAGELDNTIIVVAGDNGMQFPRGLSNLYDHGVRVPLIISWRGKMKSGKVVHDFVSFPDLAPTFLEAAGLDVPDNMSGKSLMFLFESDKSGYIDSTRNKVFLGKELHAWCRQNGEIYPMRAVRNHQYLYIRNYKPHLYPLGGPDGQFSYNFQPYGDVDPSPTKDYLLENKDTETGRYYFELAVGKRPAEELYFVQNDPGQIYNLADKPEYAEVKKRMSDELDQYLKETKDPRALGKGYLFETYPYYYSHGIETEGMQLKEWLKKQGMTLEEWKKKKVGLKK